ncbi:hypothetical protein [Mucilaginibacter glaciei]|uniref:Outer membrane protein with beta-barrel domain n=1 Tax=Mucilaginibacter glaciei TaxID=2772109 RepID=A0A926NSH2_9SPHI|nr:hypothetical protein [Mucilaginibacter glaciei]MBD1394518.1 hypothetical protein [Mucilaginibacter glaciei]
MHDQFDNDLIKRISEVFEDYSYPPANDGWAELRKKFPAEEKKDKMAWLWWGSAAAVLLVFLGIGLWFLNPQKTTENFSNQTKANHTLKDTATTGNLANATAEHSTVNDAATAGTSTDDNTAERNTEVTKKPFTGNTKTRNLAGNYGSDAQSAVLQNNTMIVVQQPAMANVPKHDLPLTPAPNITDGSKTASKLQIAANETPSVNNGITATQQVPTAKTISQLLQEENKNIVAKKETPKRVDSKRVNFSVYAATYVNYATGSANQVNGGAGFTSDIKLGNHFKLSTGVSLAQNTLRYNNMPPDNVARGQAYSAAPAAAVLSKDAGFVSNNSLAPPAFKGYNARLIGLDVPVNIKYEFNPQKSDTYISAGLSSGTFIDERYTSSYSYQANSVNANGFSSVTTQTADETATNSFNNFYFGKMLNVSFGVGYPLGKSTRLIIEPFLKYPLAGLGAQDLKFGAGGLNLKINFTSSKK